MAKIKDSERILRTVSEKQLVMYKGTPLRLSETADQKGMAQCMCGETSHNMCDERKKPAANNTLSSKTLIQIWREKLFFTEGKTERIQHY